MTAVAPRSLEATARALGRACRVEEALFAALGAWAGPATDPAVRTHLGIRARVHAGHALAWRALLPAVPHLDPAVLTAPPAGEEAALWARLVPAPDDDLALDAVDLLVGLYRVVLPRKVAEDEAARATLAPVTDGPTRRVLDAVLADERAAWVQGEALLQARLGEPDALRRASSRQLALELAVADSGGLRIWTG